MTRQSLRSLDTIAPIRLSAVRGSAHHRRGRAAVEAQLTASLVVAAVLLGASVFAVLSGTGDGARSAAPAPIAERLDPRAASALFDTSQGVRRVARGV